MTLNIHIPAKWQPKIKTNISNFKLTHWQSKYISFLKNHLLLCKVLFCCAFHSWSTRSTFWVTRYKWDFHTLKKHEFLWRENKQELNSLVIWYNLCKYVCNLKLHRSIAEKRLSLSPPFRMLKLSYCIGFWEISFNFCSKNRLSSGNNQNMAWSDRKRIENTSWQQNLQHTGNCINLLYIIKDDRGSYRCQSFSAQTY